MTKNCLICGKVIPWKMKTPEGIDVQTHGRKLCLDCSPFGERRGQTLVAKPFQKLKHGSEVVCSRCQRTYTYDHSKGHSTTQCNSCVVNVRRPARKMKAIDYKGGSCERCGYKKSPRALSFHHLDPKEKEFTIGKMMNKSWESIKKELDKCILLCANCHMEEHEELIQEQLDGRATP